MNLTVFQGFRAKIATPVPHLPGPAPSALAEVRAYWEALRQDGQPPTRAAIDPRGISGALDRVFLAERIGTGLAQIRIAGSVFADIAGMDARGLPLSCLFASVSRQRLGVLVERVFTGPMAADLQLEAEGDLRQGPLGARLILLPLLDRRGAATLVLGCLALSGPVGRGPRRFGILRAMEERLVPEKPAIAAAGTGRAHLRLVHSVG